MQEKRYNTREFLMKYLTCMLTIIFILHISFSLFCHILINTINIPRIIEPEVLLGAGAYQIVLANIFCSLDLQMTCFFILSFQTLIFISFLFFVGAPEILY
jgi:hypothetical protein